MAQPSIPLLDLSLASSPTTKPLFLSQLRHALLEVGFLYLKNYGISPELTEAVIKEGVEFFELPLEEKKKIQMIHAKSFLGYSLPSTETTAFALDHREQIDLSTHHPLPSPTDPIYHNLLAPNLWPSPEYLPEFRPVFEQYIEQMGVVSILFTSLIAEAIGLSPRSFEKYFAKPITNQQHKLKVVKYPDVKELGLPEGSEGQGVGPHKDSMLSSYLLQVGDKRGLQVQGWDGEWRDVLPIEGTVVVAIGQGMEALTDGVCKSTTHRVLSPAWGSGARYSIPFFQGVDLDVTFEELDEVGIGKIPEEVRAERKRVLERFGGGKGEVEFTFRKGGRADTMGMATLRNRVKSHPDVGERWYPELLRELKEEARK